VWEYLRNTSLDAKSWDATTIPPYHQNQFGGTIGFPIWKNKLFYFGDIEANRISIANPTTTTVPTALMRTGDFSEMLTEPHNFGYGVQLYEPNSGGAQAYRATEQTMSSAKARSTRSRRTFLSCTRSQILGSRGKHI